MLACESLRVIAPEKEISIAFNIRLVPHIWQGVVGPNFSVTYQKWTLALLVVTHLVNRRFTMMITGVFLLTIICIVSVAVVVVILTAKIDR